MILAEGLGDPARWLVGGGLILIAFIWMMIFRWQDRKRERRWAARARRHDDDRQWNAALDEVCRVGEMYRLEWGHEKVQSEALKILLRDVREMRRSGDGDNEDH